MALHEELHDVALARDTSLLRSLGRLVGRDLWLKPQAILMPLLRSESHEQLHRSRTL